MILAGFDIATRTGCTIMDGERVVHCESWKAKTKRPFGLKPQEVCVEFEAALAEEFRAHFWPLLVAHDVEAVGFEAPRTRDYDRRETVVEGGIPGIGVRVERKRASSNLAMIRGVVLCSALVGIAKVKLGIPCHPIAGDDWRKSFLGYSRAPRNVDDGRAFLKKAVMEKCRLIGVPVPNDDAGDSVGVAWHLRGLLNPRLSPAEGLFAEARQ